MAALWIVAAIPALVLYFLIGIAYGSLSWRTWLGNTKNYSYDIDRRTLAFWLFFPLTTAFGGYEGFMFEPAPVKYIRDHQDRIGYFKTCAILWPAYFVWSAIVMPVMLAIFFTVQMARFIIGVISRVLDALIIPFEKKPSELSRGAQAKLSRIFALVKSKNKKSAESAKPEKIRIAETLDAKIENARQELSNNKHKIRELQAKGVELQETILDLERQQAAEEGPEVYRAPRSSKVA